MKNLKEMVVTVHSGDRWFPDVVFFDENWKIVLIIILAGGLFWLINDRNYQASENKRQTENASQLRKADSLTALVDYLMFVNL